MIKLAIREDRGNQQPHWVQGGSLAQFRVLYREFLFRVVDLELLSAHAGSDMSRLLGQFAALLIFLNLLFSFLILLGFDNHMPSEALLTFTWSNEHFLIATTMLVVGLFAVLSWDGTFPDQRDVLVFAPLPVRARTLFLAKVAGSATGLSVTVLALNVFTGLTWPLVLSPLSSSILDLILSLALYRSFAAYWITMLAAGAFIFCSMLSVQGLAAQLLSRRQFLRVSAFLQLSVFCLLLSVYFLQPPLATPTALIAPENQKLLAWLPSYWFLGLFQELNGSMHPALIPLARRAWTGLAVAGFGAGVVFLLSYFRTLRRIAEEPDIVPGSRHISLPLRFGNTLETAIVQFSIRTLFRSRQHRVMLAFYLGIGFAIAIALMKPRLAQEQLRASQVNVALSASSFVVMCLWIVGARVAFSMPLALRANWIFRITEIRGVPEYLKAIRRSLFVLAVAPVWAVSAVLFLSIWPWRLAAGHLIILGLWGVTIAYICLHGFGKIPFTCSYFPGKSRFHMVFLAALGIILLILNGVPFERHALKDPVSYAKLLVILGIAVICAKWRLLKSDETALQFEEVPLTGVCALELHHDGVPPA